MSVSKLCLVVGWGFNAFGNITAVSSLTLDHARRVPLSQLGASSVPKESGAAVAGAGGRTHCVLQCPVVENIVGDPSNVIVSALWDATVISACECDSTETSVWHVWASPKANPSVQVLCTRETNSCIKLNQLPGRRRLVSLGTSLFVVDNESDLAVAPLHSRSECTSPKSGAVVSQLPTTFVPACVGCNADGTVFLVQSAAGNRSVLQMLQSCGSRIPEPAEVPLPFSGEAAACVACGSSHALILGETGLVYSMGLGSRGQLGHGSILSSSAPQLVEALAGLRMVAVGAGGWHSLALSVYGDLYTWGWNHDGQLGLGLESCSRVSAVGEREVVAEPSLVSMDGCEDLQFVSASCGSRHTAAVSADRRVWGWGWSAYGQVGLVSSRIPHPVEVSMQRFTTCGWEPCRVQCGPWNTFLVMCQSPHAHES